MSKLKGLKQILNDCCSELKEYAELKEMTTQEQLSFWDEIVVSFSEIVDTRKEFIKTLNSTSLMEAIERGDREKVQELEQRAKSGEQIRII